jgi:hypothetical protein
MTVNSSGFILSSGAGTGFMVKNNNEQYKLALYVGSGGENRGLYDFSTNGGWMIYRDKNNINHIEASETDVKTSIGTFQFYNTGLIISNNETVNKGRGVFGVG